MVQELIFDQVIMKDYLILFKKQFKDYNVIVFELLEVFDFVDGFLEVIISYMMLMGEFDLQFIVWVKIKG